MKNLFLLLTCCLMLLFACNKTKQADNHMEQVVVSVNMEDGLGTLQVETEQLYPNSCYVIDNELRVTLDGFRVDLLGVKNITMGGDCYAEDQVAQADISLGTLEQSSYDITFRLNGEKVSGKLLLGEYPFLFLEDHPNIRVKPLSE